MLLPISTRCVAQDVYDEQRVVGRISYDAAALRRHLDERLKENPEKFKDIVLVTPSEDMKTLVNNLGWLIIATGENSNGSEELKAAMFHVKSDVGWVTTPYWVCWEEKRKDLLKFYMRPDTLMDPDNIHPFGDNHLYWLAEEAMERVSRRAGFKFEGYKGFQLLSRP